jgi:hypothetical protein
MRSVPTIIFRMATSWWSCPTQLERKLANGIVANQLWNKRMSEKILVVEDEPTF